MGMSADESLKELHGKVIGKVQMCKGHVYAAEIKLKEENAALKAVQDILDMIERDHPEVLK